MHCPPDIFLKKSVRFAVVWKMKSFGKKIESNSTAKRIYSQTMFDVWADTELKTSNINENVKTFKFDENCFKSIKFP